MTCCHEGEKQEISNNCPCLLEDVSASATNTATDISGPFRYPDQDSPFRTLGCQNCVLRPRQFGTTFSVVSAKFRRFWKHRFLPKRGVAQKNTKMMMGAAPETYFGLFFRNPDFDLHVANLTPTMSKTHFPAILGIFAHCKKETGFTPYPTQKHLPYVKSKNVL